MRAKKLEDEVDIAHAKLAEAMNKLAEAKQDDISYKEASNVLDEYVSRCSDV